MTPLERIKALSDSISDDYTLTNQEGVAVGVIHELLALWEAAEKWREVPYYFDDQRQEDAHDGLSSALDALNLKASEALSDDLKGDGR